MIVVIGIGNPYRRDDGVGYEVIHRLETTGITARLATSDGEPTDLIDLWDGAELAVVVDAVRSGTARPGTIHELTTLPPSHGTGTASSHAIDIGDTFELARVLDRLPQRLVILAVEAADLSQGVGISADVAEAIPAVIDRVTTLAASRLSACHVWRLRHGRSVRHWGGASAASSYLRSVPALAPGVARGLAG
ncbi:hydrogenase maturation protease [Stackebrandtia nassauensis]|uniref:Hydrogenase maturation protease n=1 Tax=Stackebrandtia nassauensis (strain DSM 44728 / CIP 108903 / NRRL B-16338 / NBRC 102104 / LLR-40K-21) TaxID=446470 RepID=D3PVI2_STANL|nr:hydrogenase maturation protease [Stackebrandtia nassauensis]ADD43096.1 hydrogenase maturation protease [Stackebrandtia nassauensis DSM 44728]